MNFGTTIVLQNDKDHLIFCLHMMTFTNSLFLLKETLGYNSKPLFVSPYPCQDVLVFVMQRKLLVEVLSVNCTTELSEERVADKK